MASALFISNAMAKKCADALNVATTGFGTAVMTIYSSSTTKPANANTALDGAAAVLATITLPAYGSNSVSSVGVITFGVISPATPSANGVASYFRIMASDTTTVVCDGNIGLAAATPDLVVADTTFSTGVPVAITSFTYTVTQ